MARIIVGYYWKLGMDVEFMASAGDRVRISVKAYFKDKRSASDLDNLKKLLGDAIQQGIDVDDKYFNFVDFEPSFDMEYPRLKVELVIIKGGV